ncbi:DUF4265 domain-containing protein [Roseateles depolymerans]|uniref:Uncharacterized protein n=1 Tax=Roseateles depolymerans TaxID=76731 RepID=A0A0U3MX07_9BURK|nr:DUF4265 domain-containing protein [Roseateles depolymerans]ALV06452.1 hypothetical protein RD2015_1976 [Roseateles depolymerans]REG19427.1 uncharacterized protein DUF4265 [Roseateles depolymerans]
MSAAFKVLWHLEQDEDEWPPYPVESIWCSEVATGHFKLLNVPYFAHGVAWGDVVTVTEKDDGRWFAAVVVRSGYSTVHAFCADPATQEKLRAWAEQLQCVVETAYGGKYWAIGIPPEVPIAQWQGFLTSLEADGLEYDVAWSAGALAG